MVRKLLCFCWFWFTISVTYAQDIITRSDGVEIKANVLDVQTNIVRFRLFQQTDSLIYQINTRDVKAVQMADGTIRSFAEANATYKLPETFDYENSSGQNIIWLYPFDLIYPKFTMAYERILATGKVGFRFPFTFGLAGNSENIYYNTYRKNNRYGAGLEVNVYPWGQGRLQYYFGPAFNFESYQSYYFDNSSPQRVPQKQNSEMYSLALKNGIYFQFSRFFIISADFGLGIRFFRQSELPANYYYTVYPDNRTRAYFPGNAHLGFRF
jgi:hypothetical protein